MKAVSIKVMVAAIAAAASFAAFADKVKMVNENMLKNATNALHRAVVDEAKGYTDTKTADKVTQTEFNSATNAIIADVTRIASEIAQDRITDTTNVIDAAGRTYTIGQHTTPWRYYDSPADANQYEGYSFNGLVWQDATDHSTAGANYSAPGWYLSTGGAYNLVSTDENLSEYTVNWSFTYTLEDETTQTMQVTTVASRTVKGVVYDNGRLAKESDLVPTAQKAVNYSNNLYDSVARENFEFRMQNGYLDLICTTNVNMRSSANWSK